MNEESDMSSYQHPDVNRQKQNYLLQYNRQIKKFPTEKQNVSLKHILT